MSLSGSSVTVPVVVQVLRVDEHTPSVDLLAEQLTFTPLGEPLQFQFQVLPERVTVEAEPELQRLDDGFEDGAV